MKPADFALIIFRTLIKWFFALPAQQVLDRKIKKISVSRRKMFAIKRVLPYHGNSYNAHRFVMFLHKFSSSVVLSYKLDSDEFSPTYYYASRGCTVRV